MWEVFDAQVETPNCASVRLDVISSTIILVTDTCLCGKVGPSEVDPKFSSYEVYCRRSKRIFRGMKAEHRAAVDELRFWMRSVECPAK